MTDKNRISEQNLQKIVSILGFISETEYTNNK